MLDFAPGHALLAHLGHFVAPLLELGVVTFYQLLQESWWEKEERKPSVIPRKNADDVNYPCDGLPGDNKSKNSPRSYRHEVFPKAKCMDAARCGISGCR